MIDNRIVGRKIAAMRQESGLTQLQLAAMMNVSHQAVSKWESGQALPDIQTMQELTRFFGITVDQLISRDEIPDAATPAEDAYEPTQMNDTNEESIPAAEEREVKNMSIQQLLQMAPYMSKEIVEEIVMEIEDKLSAQQIARVAPYVRAECVEALMEKHKPELTWDSLRRIAPYLRREYVDGLAKDVASGKETIKPAGDNINKAINDIGKTIDDIGHEMKHAVKKGLRFGKTVIREVSSALSDLSSDNCKTAEPAAPVRSERAISLRRKAFERALADGKWDWIAAHIRELDNEAELRSRIADAARENGMHEWICRHMGAYADAGTIEAAISTGNWAWLGENAWQLDAPAQEKIALAAMQAENWQWLAEHEERLCLTGCGLEIAISALKAGQKQLAVRLAENHLLPEEVSRLADAAYENGDFDALDMLIGIAADDLLDHVLEDMAQKQNWELAAKYLDTAMPETIEKLMEIAVDQGDFDAVDMLDTHM